MAKILRKPTNAPRVVLLGRTNAGKSTLFNRLTEEGKAIVSAAMNTTRDQNRDMVYWLGNMCELIDTGGLDMAAYDPLDKEIQNQVQLAVKDSSAIIFVVDGRADLMPQDKAVAKWLHTLGKPVVLCVNKMDNRKKRFGATGEFAKLGLKHEVMCSALNGSGTGDLMNVLFELIPHVEAPIMKEEHDTIRVALVGRPNVGKSSLFNAMSGESKVIVSDIAHTTRDINDTELIYQGKSFTIVDTAGIRRKNRVGEWEERGLSQIERRSVRQALAAIERSDVVVLMMEAQKRISSQDRTLLDFAQSHGKGVIVAINKWDLIPDKDASVIYDYTKYFRVNLDLHDHIPLVFISALEKQRVSNILDLADEIYTYNNYKAPQEELDRVLRTVMKHEPKQRQIRGQTLRKKPLEIISLTQVGNNPPTFRVVSPHPKEVAPAIMHLIEKGIRERCSYTGVPLRLMLRNS